MRTLATLVAFLIAGCAGPDGPGTTEDTAGSDETRTAFNSQQPWINDTASFTLYGTTAPYIGYAEVDYHCIAFNPINETRLDEGTMIVTWDGGVGTEEMTLRWEMRNRVWGGQITSTSPIEATFEQTPWAEPREGGPSYYDQDFMFCVEPVGFAAGLDVRLDYWMRFSAENTPAVYKR